jgi:hypothetical protein
MPAERPTASAKSRIHYEDIVTDPLLRRARREVDQTLLAWARGLSPLERLRACSNASRALDRFRRAPSTTR